MISYSDFHFVIIFFPDEARTVTVMPPVKLEEQLSSEIEVKISSVEPASSDFHEKPPVESTYFSAAGEPLVICSDVCNKPCPTTCDTDGICLKEDKPCLGQVPKVEALKKEPIIETPLEEPKEKEKEITIEREDLKISVKSEEIEEVHIKSELIDETYPEGEVFEVPIEKVIKETDVLLAAAAQPSTPVEYRRTWEPPPCTESCGSDQPCAMGKPCYIIKSQGDESEAKEGERIPRSSSWKKIESIIESGIEGLIETKYPSDAIIELPEEVPPESEFRHTIEKILIDEFAEETIAVTTATPGISVLTSEVEVSQFQLKFLLLPINELLERFKIRRFYLI